ncbi:MAG: two-component regulator propeller domain-containing protein [Bacteroidales bacterium]|nr:two-component regulator propeller domain-containing protein [Bacteroidales bacterium]
MVFIAAILTICSGVWGMDRKEVEEAYQKTFYTVNDGLTQNEITAIVQDKYGFMWFGTRGGLNRFDGYEFLKFKPEPGVGGGLKSPSIEVLFPDRAGNIWIGTKSGGLSFYDIDREHLSDPDTSGSFPIRIISYYEDDSGHFWIGSWANGVFEFDPGTGAIHHYLANQRVSSILQTSDGTMWFGASNGLRFKKSGDEEIGGYSTGAGYFEVTEMVEDTAGEVLWLVGWNVGLVRFNYRELTHRSYDLADGDAKTLDTYSLLADQSGNLWVGTWGNGLYRFSSRDETSARVSLVPQFYSNPTMDLDIVLDIFQDQAGDLWVGTDGGGVVRLSLSKSFRTLLSHEFSGAGSWHINSLCISGKDALWIGTRVNGLHYKAAGQSSRFVGFGPVHPDHGDTRFRVKALYADLGDTIWVGLENGLFIVDESAAGNRQLVNASYYFNSPDLWQLRKVTGILRHRGNLFVATQQNGLYRFREQEGKYQLADHFHNGDIYSSFEDNRVSALMADADDNLWIGTYKGLYRLGKTDSVPVHANRLLRSGTSAFLCDIILSCTTDAEGRIWIGTPCGLNSLSKMGADQYDHVEYTNRDGLTDDFINAVQYAGNYIWMSTNAGISRLDPSDETIRNYNVNGGIWGFSFSEGATAKSRHGSVHFGGSSDVVYFDPGTMDVQKDTPVIAITKFRVMNRDVPVDASGLLPRGINEVEEITLDHRQKEFSFEVAVLDYRSPESNQYAYRLSDVVAEGEWIYTGQRRQISFSNLKPGTYTLQLAGSNSNGIWNWEGRELTLHILPPPWKTGYALIIYIAVILALVALINRVSLKQERLKSQAEMEHMSRMKESEMNEFKLRFFTDISHELKTPLSLIQAPVEELINKDFKALSPGFFSKRLALIRSSTIRLSDLLNQLLEFRKVEVGKARLQASFQDVEKYVKEICEAYKFLAESKGILFSMDLRTREPRIWFEPSKMDVIVNNLLSNALKYSGTPGKAGLELEDTETEILLKVTNDGEGITEDEAGKLFERFYQAPGVTYRRGYGIGLDLVKRFVEMHGGSIAVESKPGSFTTFTVRLKKGSAHLDQDQMVDTNAVTVPQEVIPPFPEAGEAGGGRLPRGVKNARVLVVEDKEEVREYLAELLEEHFEVIKADNGSSGYELVVTELPDLVLSDVMMPETDGYELCERIRKNERTAHIPVLLLTAKGTRDDQLMGTRRGADGYISKPFDPVLLLEKVKQLIAARHRVAEKYMKKISLEPLRTEISSEDEKLIRSALIIIEKKISDPELDAESLAREMGMSSSTLYRRMKKLVKQSPGEFIKSTRIKMAARYLKETHLTVSEIVEKVGYTDTRNFRESFREKFGVSPSEYRSVNEE